MTKKYLDMYEIENRRMIDKCSSERNRAADSFVDLEGCMYVELARGLTDKMAKCVTVVSN
jgi:hypothetical protein